MFYRITACFLLSTCLVTGLYFFSARANHAPNGFIRLFRPHTIVGTRSADLQYNSYYIAGLSQKNVWLADAHQPLHLLQMSESLSATGLPDIQADSNILKKLHSVKIAVDSPYFYLRDGLSPLVLRGTLQQMSARSYTYDSIYFTDAVNMSATSFALRTSRSGIREYTLAKEQATEPHNHFVPGLLQNQGDGYFSTDGMLLFNQKNSRVIYLYYYRNEFICMDSNLSLQYRGKTIDTTSTAKVKVKTTNGGNTIMLASPPPVINNKACTYGNFLFVYAALLSNNEDKRNFDKASVIDVYNIVTGRYRFSFYLYDFAGKKVRDIGIYNNRLLAIHDHWIVSYELDKSIFN